MTGWIFPLSARLRILTQARGMTASLGRQLGPWLLVLLAPACGQKTSDAGPSDTAGGGSLGQSGGAGPAGAESGGGSGGEVNSPSGGSGAMEPGTGGSDSGGTLVESGADPIYLQASNADAGDLFGGSIALSGDALTLAVGASREASAVADATFEDNAAADSGALYVFSAEGGPFEQNAYLKADDPLTGDVFGSAVALSADGKTLAVGAPYEMSATENGEDALDDAGGVYLFEREDDTWRLQEHIKPSVPQEDSFFGISLSLSQDGSTLAVGAEGENSASTGVEGDPYDDSAGDAGAVYVFRQTDELWQQDAYLKASNAEAGDRFGGSVALSADGTSLAVGAYWEDGAGSGNGGDQQSNSASYAGAVYVFERDSSSWRQLSYLKPSHNSGDGSNSFGVSVSLSGDGKTLAVGASGDSSGAVGIDGDQTDSSAPFAGAAYVFQSEDGTSWQEAAYLKAANADAGDEFGGALSLSADGRVLLVGAAFEGSDPSSGDAENNAALEAGAAYLFRVENEAWQQAAFLKAIEGDAGDRFGWSTALSADGAVLAVGASRESSAARAIDGDREDNSAPRAGAVYIYPAQDSLQQ